MKTRGVGSNQRGAAFTPIELLVIIGVLAVLIAIILPAIRPAPRVRSPRIHCINNLKNIGLAFRIFATDNEDRFPMQNFTNQDGVDLSALQPTSRYLAILSNELSTPKILVCPADKRRKPASNFYLLRNSGISYFVGLDATEDRPNTLLAGDRNLMTNGIAVNPGLVSLTTNMSVGWTKEIHNNQGNVAMGDGSVQQFSNARLAQGLRDTGMATNRLLVP